MPQPTMRLSTRAGRSMRSWSDCWKTTLGNLLPSCIQSDYSSSVALSYRLYTTDVIFLYTTPLNHLYSTSSSQLAHHKGRLMRIHGCSRNEERHHTETILWASDSACRAQRQISTAAFISIVVQQRMARKVSRWWASSFDSLSWQHRRSGIWEVKSRRWDSCQALISWSTKAMGLTNARRPASNEELYCMHGCLVMRCMFWVRF